MSEPIQLIVNDVGDNAGCSPWSNIIGCPITIYTVLVIIFAISQLMAIINAPSVNTDGQPVSQAARWGWGIVILIIYLLIAYGFGSWMYNLCNKSPTCGSGSSWLVFLLAIFFPIILAVIATIIFGAVIGVGSVLAKGSKSNKQLPVVVTGSGSGNVADLPEVDE